ncbi:MAG: VWA domain-containing protein [Akkermansiaceae bacterium]|nr:VWA domain-containing protein [Akkermansiaceae bacterium]
MTFTSPEWFFLLAVLVFAGWFWPRLQLWRPLRAILLLLVTLLLADPQLTRNDSALDLWVLLDRSESTEDLVDKGLPEWKELLRRAKPSRRDELRFVDYASEVLEQGEGEAAIYTGSRKLTRTNLAVQNVLALADAGRPARVLVFSDGFSTEPLVEAAAKLKARGIPLDYRLVREDTTDDFSVARLELPTRSQMGEPFVLGIAVRGFTDTILPLRVYRDGQLLTETEVTIEDGVGKVEFTDRLAGTGAYRYEAEIVPETDAHPGNNRAERWIEITGGPRILLVSKYTDDPVAAVLTNQGFTVETAANPLTLRVGQLNGARAVILNNVPAYEIPIDFLDALDFFVREQGGGLLMAGGKQSFAAGGYFQSPVDALLPVSMELKSEHRKLAVALAIVMDRSGSMSMSVAAGGGKQVSKMDLANAGAAKAIDLLGGMDKVCVYAVDSEPHTILKLTTIGNRKKTLMQKVRRVQSRGGGIYVYRGLKAAWEELKKADIGTRHIILFSDAADSEQPGDYINLLDDVTKNGGSVSVIGLGTRADPDAQLLEDIAKRGNGRIFFTSRPLEIPKLFAQETVTVARSAFIEEPVEAQPTGQWSEISPKPFEWLSSVDGYNLSYVREDATPSLVSKDEYLAPLVAHARRGIGRSMAVSFPLGGEHSEMIRGWPAYGDFVQTLGRWLMGFDLPPGLGLRHRLEGTRLTVDLLYDTEEWSQRFASEAPRVKLVEGETGGTPYEVAWKRIAPGHFSMARELDEGVVIRGAVQAGPHAIPFGPLVVGSSAEWSFDPDRLKELREVSRLSGGRELLDLSTAWLRPPATHSTDLRLPLLIAALAIMLFEALITRMGWKLPVLVPAGARQRRKPAKSRKKQAGRRQPRPHESPAPGPVYEAPEAAEAPAEAAKKPPPAAKPAETSTRERTSRFDRAKRRK